MIMSEKDELAKLEERKKKIEFKYAKIAKKRLHKINEIVAPNQLITDMNENEFRQFLNTLQQEMTWVKNVQQQNRNNQQQQRPQNNQYRG